MFYVVAVYAIILVWIIGWIMWPLLVPSKPHTSPRVRDTYNAYLDKERAREKEDYND